MIYASLILLCILLWFWNSINYKQEKKKLESLVSTKVEEGISEYRWAAIKDLEEMTISTRNKVVSTSEKNVSNSGASPTIADQNNSLVIKLDNVDVTGFLHALDGHIIDSLVYESINDIDQSFSFEKIDKDYITDDIRFDYNDIAAQKHTYFTLTNYQGYLFKKILWEFLGSLLILFLLSTTLFLLYKIYTKSQEEVKIRDEFISTISHELRTPVATVGAALEAISQHDVIDNKERTLKYIHLASEETDRLKRLINRSLQSQHGWSIHKNEFDIKTMLNDVVDQNLLKHPDAMIELESNTPIYSINADKDHLTQVIHNLLDNSIKYRNGHPKIKIVLNQTEKQTIIQVEDNGIGIPKQYLNRVTEKMFRVPSGNVHKVKGYGLGLDYVHQIVELHNGNLNFESEEGQGTLVTITIPNA